MLKGKPRAVAWSASDAIMRLFEMDANDVFQEIAQAPLANVGSFVPNFAFSKTAKYVMAGGNRVAATYSHAAFDESLQQTDIQTFALSSTADRKFARNALYGMHYVGAATPAFIHVVNEDTGLMFRDNRTGILNLGATNILRGFSHNGQNSLALYNASLYAGVAFAVGTTGVAPYEFPAFVNAAVRQTVATSLLTMIASSSDDQFIYTGNAAGLVSVHPFSGAATAGSMGASIGTVSAAGSVSSIVSSPDDKYVAVSRVSGGVYTTTVYTRVGGTLTVLQTINTFGASLEFSGDGFFLIDGISKLARKFNGVNFAAANGAMANLPVTVSSFSLSHHVDGVNGFARVYNEAAFDYSGCDVDETNIRVMLLSDAAAFVATHNTVLQVTNGGAWQVSGGGWAAGGQLLANVQHTLVPSGETEVTANNVTVTLNADLTFRYALIYDDTSDTPLTLIDYIDTYTAPALTTLDFDFSSPGFLKFTPV